MVTTDGVMADISPVIYCAYEFGYSVKCTLGDVTVDFNNSLCEYMHSLNTNITVSAYDVSANYERILGDVYADGYKVRDITVKTENGTKLFTDSSVSLPVSVEIELTGEAAVYYISDSGLLTKISGAYSNGKVSFTAPHLSKYAVGELLGSESGDDLKVSFKGKLSAFMDTLYIRYYFETEIPESDIARMGTLVMKADEYVKSAGLTLDNATEILLGDNNADDQYATLGKFSLMKVYARDINVVYKVRPFIETKDGSIYYGETEEYGMSVYLNNQLNKETSTAVYKEVLNALLAYGSAMDAYANRAQ